MLDRPTSEAERRSDVRAAVIFLVVIGASLLGLLIATTRWRPASWAALAAAAASLQAVGVLVALGVALGQLKEARQLRLDQTRPFVTIDLVSEQPPLLTLEVANIGAVVARDVQLSFDPPLRTTGDELSLAIADVRFLAGPIPTLVPGKRLSTFFDTVPERGDRFEDCYEAKVRYRSDDGRTFEDHYVLDVDQYRNATYVQHLGVHDIAKHLETAVKTLKGIDAALRTQQRAAD